MGSKSRLTLILWILFPAVCPAQTWEVGALGGYAWYHDATITNQFGQASVGMAPKGGIGAVFGENLYKHIGGEVRWMLLFGPPRLSANGIDVTRSGYSNLVHYDLLIHTTPAEARVRPFLAGGAGVRVFTATGRRNFLQQPLASFALLNEENEAEALISAGGGLKVMLKKDVQLRFDFRAYMSPAPKELFRPTGTALIHGWIYTFVPSLGVSYVF